MKKITSAILNLQCGNLTDAKEMAKNYSSWKIMTAAEELGYPIAQQVAIAGYLKNIIDFQKYCDTMNK